MMVTDIQTGPPPPVHRRGSAEDFGALIDAAAAAAPGEWTNATIEGNRTSANTALLVAVGRRVVEVRQSDGRLYLRFH